MQNKDVMLWPGPCAKQEGGNSLHFCCPDLVKILHWPPHFPGLPLFSPPPGEYLMAGGAFNWQVCIIFHLPCVQNWIRKKKIMFLDPHTHDVRCEPAAPSPALLSPSPVLITLALWVLHMHLAPFPHSTCCSAVPRVSSPPPPLEASA